MCLGCASNRIDTPKDGFTVRYLWDILQSTKLFVRPLQKNIELKVEAEMEDFVVSTDFVFWFVVLVQKSVLCFPSE